MKIWSLLNKKSLIIFVELSSTKVAVLRLAIKQILLGSSWSKELLRRKDSVSSAYFEKIFCVFGHCTNVRLSSWCIIWTNFMQIKMQNCQRDISINCQQNCAVLLCFACVSLSQKKKFFYKSKIDDLWMSTSRLIRLNCRKGLFIINYFNSSNLIANINIV